MGILQYRGVAIATTCFLLLAFQDSCTLAQISPTPPDQPSLARVFFECKNQVYHNQSMDMLFPPSAVSRRLIDDIAAAKEEQKITMEAFCSSASDFFGCVKQGLRQSSDVATNNLNSLLNPNLGEAFSIFCSNKELINSQFECTLSSLNNHVCNGGVHDVMEMSYAMGLDVDTLCSDVVSRMTCRVKTQLSSCDMEYSNIMAEFYQALFSDSCRTIFLPKKKKRSFPLPCVEDHWKNIEKIYNEMDGKNINTIVERITDALKTFCSTHFQEFMNCVEESTEAPQKTIGVLIKNFVNLETYRNLGTYVCSKVPDVKPQMKCLIKAIQDEVSSSNCLREYSKIGIDSAIKSYTKLEAQTFIDAAVQMAYCIEPVFRNCDNGIGSIYHYVIQKYAEMTQDPEKVLAVSDEDRNSTTTHQYPTLLTLLCLALIVKELVSIWV